MPETTSVHSHAAAEADTANTTLDVAANTAMQSLPPGVPDTPAIRSLWGVLAQRLGASTADLAAAAHVGQSTAAKALNAMEKAGIAAREKGRQGSKILPDRWTATGPSDAAPREPSQTTSAGADAHEVTNGDGEPVGQPTAPRTGAERYLDQRMLGPEYATAHREAAAAIDRAPVKSDSAEASAAQPVGDRLRPGALRELVAGCFRDRPNDELSPGGIGRVLNRSAGAVANACEKLAGEGLIVETSAKPRRYRLAKRADAAAGQETEEARG